MTEHSSLLLTAHAASHVGLVRAGNEDALLCGEGVYVVADGLGGHAAGEVASATAVERLTAFDAGGASGPDELQRALAETVRAANRAVYDAAQAEPGKAGMGTTVTAGAVAQGCLVLAHVGDSRAYLHRASSLRQLTTDHTAAQQAVDGGYLTPEEAARRPERHMLARAVGLEPDVAVDAPPPLELQAGDRLLLCSDGLTEPVEDAAIATILDEHPDPAVACDTLVQAALDGGGPDNVTVLVVRVDGPTG